MSDSLKDLAKELRSHLVILKIDMWQFEDLVAGREEVSLPNLFASFQEVQRNLDITVKKLERSAS